MDWYMGEIRMFAGRYAPHDWAFCDGRALSPTEHGALYSLIGTTYGGDGATTFKLPDLRGRLPLHCGQGPGLSMRLRGAAAGSEAVTLKNIPVHRHLIEVGDAPTAKWLKSGYLADSTYFKLYSAANPDSIMHAGVIAPVGNAQPHANLMPSLCVNFIIALEGNFPQAGELAASAMALSSSGEIRLFGFGFAPLGWALCDGTGALPDLRGRTLLHRSADYPLGMAGGLETVTLAAASQVPLHRHTVAISGTTAETNVPANEFLAAVHEPGGCEAYAGKKSATAQTLAPGALTRAGDACAHDNMQPWLALTACADLTGIARPAAPYIGEIRAFASGPVAPGWAACDGQLLPVAQYPALYSLMGTTYGGDGTLNFGLPNLQGRAPMGAGAGPQLTPRTCGDALGNAAVPLTIDHFPPHTHALKVVSNVNADHGLAANHFLARSGKPVEPFNAINMYQGSPMQDGHLAEDAVRATGEATVLHDNMQPYLSVLLCIALEGNHV